MITLRKFAIALLVAAGVGFTAGTAFTEDPAPDMDAQQKAMMDLMFKLAEPGEQHALLARMEGEWDVATRAWPMGKLQESKGWCRNRMVLGGRYLHTDWKGEMFGKPHTGIGMMGYDNGKQHYHSQWYDSMSSACYQLIGQASDDGSSISSIGTWEMKLPDGQEMKMKTRMVYTFKDADTFVMEHYSVMGDKEVREMELTYKRRKPAQEPAQEPAQAPARRAGPGCCPPRGKGPGY